MTVADAHKVGAVTLNYGAFVNSLVTFVIIAFCVFMIVRMASKLYAKPAPPPDNMKSCPRCTLSIPKGREPLSELHVRRRRRLTLRHSGPVCVRRAAGKTDTNGLN